MCTKFSAPGSDVPLNCGNSIILGIIIYIYIMLIYQLDIVFQVVNKPQIADGTHFWNPWLHFPGRWTLPSAQNPHIYWGWLLSINELGIATVDFEHKVRLGWYFRLKFHDMSICSWFHIVSCLNFHMICSENQPRPSKGSELFLFRFFPGAPGDYQNIHTVNYGDF